ncbi:nucleotidyltransferase domain-containing protein [Sphaerisporangium sp. TRM90804]|uniref:nucleotidyltransferase domain-containing protein n=1 Tax=Sphaerisporangium sp. TRM90804 TaxID=3031113 RepID=UPI00244A8792|nr:nucleotidyltransferase domain-containing protein [Sphaerisporangium sp. TRM90804]MDH2425804.1 nucleotidyltransferase domain-containing protein [Sphaerisporangium sp. TRM90804]
MQTTRPTTVALSGPDNVGKTTHARLLARRHSAHNPGPLDDYDPRWRDAKKRGLATWWLHAAPVAEVVDVLACSYLARSAARNDTIGTFRIIDRGMTMLDASVVATVAARDRLSHEAAVERASDLLAPYAADIAAARAAEHELLLLHHVDPGRGAQIALSREETVTPAYTRYQRALNQRLNELASTAVVVDDLPIMTVQAELCSRLHAQGLPVAPPAITGRWTVALGGMSECGKSSAGAHLQHEHGFTRLKISYLLQCAAAHHQLADVYALPAVEQAELLVLELDRYAAAHHYQERFSIESLHSFDLTREVAKLLGAAATVLYLQASQSIRCQRGTRGREDVLQRDAVKGARGADRVREIADVVIDNDGSQTELGHALDRLVRGRLWQARVPRVVASADLGLPDRLTGFLDHLLVAVTGPGAPVALVAVTGSGARGKYLEGWSDLDVLIVAAPAALATIRAALGDAHTRLGGVKLGLTVITPGECQTAALTSRLIYTIASIASGALPVLWAAPGFLMPQPDAGTIVARTRRDGATAAMDLRRVLLRDPVDLRATYKVAALLAKIVLKCEGQTHHGDADAIEAFAKLAHLPAVPLDPRADAAATITLAEHILTWWLRTLEPAA